MSGPVVTIGWKRGPPVYLKSLQVDRESPVGGDTGGRGQTLYLKFLQLDCLSKASPSGMARPMSISLLEDPASRSCVRAVALGVDAVSRALRRVSVRDHGHPASLSGAPRGEDLSPRAMPKIAGRCCRARELGAGPGSTICLRDLRQGGQPDGIDGRRGSAPKRAGARAGAFRMQRLVHAYFDTRDAKSSRGGRKIFFSGSENVSSGAVVWRRRPPGGTVSASARAGRRPSQSCLPPSLRACPSRLQPSGRRCLIRLPQSSARTLRRQSGRPGVV